MVKTFAVMTRSPQSHRIAPPTHPDQKIPFAEKPPELTVLHY
jgi:hypothetical protein